MLRTPDNPGGVPIEVFDGLRAASPVDRWQLYRDLAGHRNALECIAAFSATDPRRDLDGIDMPTLVIHGDDDQVVPFEVDAKASAARIAGATFTVYPGVPHGITDTHKELLGADLLAFVNS